MPISTEFHSDLKELVLSLLLECMSELVFEQYYCGSASITVAAAAVQLLLLLRHLQVEFLETVDF